MQFVEVKPSITNAAAMPQTPAWRMGLFVFFLSFVFFFNKSPHSRVVMKEETIHRGHNSL